MTFPITIPPAEGRTLAPPDGEARRLSSDLFHALSQPLTALRCSLELALQQAPTVEQYHESVSRALAQAERVSWQLMHYFADVWIGTLTLLVAVWPIVSGKPLRIRPAFSQTSEWRTVDPVAQRVLQVVFFLASLWCWIDLALRLSR